MTDPTAHDVPIDAGQGGYVRWRPRMVRLSVLADVERVLTSTGWTSASLKHPFTVREFFPEFAIYEDDTAHVNTLVLDNAEPQGLDDFELGLNRTQVYGVNMAFYAQDEDTGIALFSDLSDRYEGVTDAPYISLFDYNAGDPPPLITRMEVEAFNYVKASMEVAPWEHHLWYAQLVVRDFVDGTRSDMPS